MEAIEIVSLSKNFSFMKVWIRKNNRKEECQMTVNFINECVKLNSGIEIPQIGLGVLHAENGEETKNAVLCALEAGYRSIDTASIYGNEHSVGDAVRESGLKREDVFVTTKVWNTDQGYENTLRAFDKSLKTLGFDYLDMYLVHFAVPGKYVDTWRAMEKLLKDGFVRTIGVCNFQNHHLDDLLTHAVIKPAVNQIELHPYFTQKEMLQFNTEHEISTEAWSPLARGLVFNEKIIQDLAKKYDKTPAQIVLRWELQLGAIIIPKSVHKERIIENTKIFDFELTEEEISAIDTLGRSQRGGIDPDHIPSELL